MTRVEVLRELVRAVIEGREPAESLPRRQREDLMCAWIDAGWTDVQIAAHTGWSTYTVARIRRSLGLARNYDPARSADPFDAPNPEWHWLRGVA